ncbi:hypothetical protein ACFL6X_06175 [Candidatus Latescibacterota bacterium]
MIVWVLVVVSIGLLAASLRMWLEFTQRIRQLDVESASTRSLVQSHQGSLAAAKAKIDTIKAEYESLLSERSTLDTKVREHRQQLTALEERRERSHPSHRRVDMDDEEELF